MNYGLLAFFLSCLLFSCFLSPKYRDISEFNLQPKALKENEPVRLLFSVTGSANNQEVAYYNHLIVVSEETGDTVNILTPVNHGLTGADGERIFNYISMSDPAAKAMLMDSDALRQITHIDSIKGQPDEYTTVARHPEYDAIAHNDYPTVIGVIGTTSGAN